jgi:hypothetical protein
MRILEGDYSRKIIIAAGVFVLSPVAPAIADTIEYRYTAPAPAFIERTTTVQTVSPRVVPRVVENPVLIVPDTAGAVRSNYAKRLADMADQLSMAFNRGWISQAQYDNLKDWHNSVSMEEMVLRNNDGGVVTTTNADQLERHLNGLAYTINQSIAAGSAASPE